MESLTRIQAFVQVVDAGGFSAAARKLGKSKALISKYVRELEDELGARLLNRTTRQLSLTEVGQVYHRDASDILQRIDDLTASVRDTQREPRGLLRVSAPRTFSDTSLGDAIMDFLVAHPQISLDLDCEDRFVDLVEEGYDVAIRIAMLADSSLVARRLSSFREITCASPGFLASSGIPTHPRMLAELPCIIDTNSRLRSNWTFVDNGERISIPVKGRAELNNPTNVRQAALAGLGIARMPYFEARASIEAGTLVEVLSTFQPPETAGIYAVYPHRRHLSTKVRAFVDHMVDWFDRRRAAGDIW